MANLSIEDIKKYVTKAVNYVHSEIKSVREDSKETGEHIGNTLSFLLRTYFNHERKYYLEDVNKIELLEATVIKNIDEIVEEYDDMRLAPKKAINAFGVYAGAGLFMTAILVEAGMRIGGESFYVGLYEKGIEYLSSPTPQVILGLSAALSFGGPIGFLQTYLHKLTENRYARKEKLNDKIFGEFIISLPQS